MILKVSSQSVSEVEKDYLKKTVLRIPYGKGNKKSIMKLMEWYEPSLLPFETELYAVSSEELIMYLCLEIGTPLKLIHMQDNSVDGNAIGVFFPKYGTEDLQLGCIWGIFASLLAPIMDEGREVSCEVTGFVCDGPHNIGIRIRLSESSSKTAINLEEEI